MTKQLSLAALTSLTFDPDHLVALAAPDRPALTWAGFRTGLAALRAGIHARGGEAWALQTEDHGLFLLGLIALLQCGKEIHLVSVPGEGTMPLLSDSSPKASLRLSAEETTSVPPAANDFPRIDPDTARLVFHTSGSTGAPKLVPKSLRQAENETAVLAALWGNDVRDAAVFSTVSPLHFYGFLFTALLPFYLGASVAPVRIQFPETLIELGARKTVLVSSPAFLKRLGDLPAGSRPATAPVKVLSSGGFLPEGAAWESQAALGAPVHEIYGSTETGGIAWRSSPGNAPWTIFEGVKISGMDDDGFTVASSYLSAPGTLRIEDRIETVGPNRIRLLGRTDSVVKIEEKRVALNDVENRLSQTGLAEDVIVLAFEDGRQYLAAAVVLNRAGRDKFAGRPKIEINRFFNKYLRDFFEPLVIPRKWRFPESIPRNPQGKIDRRAARGLFADQPAVVVTEPCVLGREETPGRLALTLNFPSEYIHFQGHFPAMKLLPAVVQVDWAIKFAHRHFGTPLTLKEIPRFKCVKPIFPDTAVKLELGWDAAKAQLAFSFTDPADGSTYSQGKINQAGPA